MKRFAIAGALLWSCASAETTQPSITIERMGCYGPCPIYVFTLWSDGAFSWQGRHYVAKFGTLHGRLEPAVFERAMKALEAARYLEFRSSYVSMQEDGCKEEWTDHPTVRIAVRGGASSKDIVHYLGCRGFDREAALIKMEDGLDEIFGTKAWIGPSPR